MEEIMAFIGIYYIEILMGLILGIFVLLIIALIQGIKLKKIKERYNLFVRGMNGIDVEGLFIKTHGDIMDIRRDLTLFEKNLTSLETRHSFTIQRIGFIRYNAFNDVGSDLSFSIALLDHFQNGFVLTSIYGRENSVCYAKPLKNGESKIPLSVEEMLAIDRALKGEELVNA